MLDNSSILAVVLDPITDTGSHVVYRHVLRIFID